ncbi:MAG: hypothetical protein IJK42_05660 [Prevotella sp.]|nr:hypothetical protein [Prevotella sp.]
MEKKYVIPRCNKIEIVEKGSLLEGSTTPNGFIVGNDDNWVNDPNSRPKDNMWDL